MTYANVIATVALFVALGGGAYAAFHLPKNSVKSKNIVNGQVRDADLANPFVRGPGRLVQRQVDIPSNNGNAFTLMRVPGVGTLSVEVGECQISPGLVSTALNWKNTTNSPERLTYEGFNNSTSATAGPHGTATPPPQLSIFADSGIFPAAIEVSSYSGRLAVLDLSAALGDPAGHICRFTVQSTQPG